MTSRRVLAAWALSLLTLWGAASNAAPAQAPRLATPAGQLVGGELEFRQILSKNDPEALRAYYNDRLRLDVYRARALTALHPDSEKTLDAQDRTELMGALADPAPLVRFAAVQALGRSGDAAFARQILQLAAEDTDPYVRAEALRAARPWTKLSHLYFLEAALRAEAPEVRVEALRSLAELKDKEISPAFRERLLVYLSPEQPPAVRLAVLETFHRWNRLTWSLLKGILVETREPETLRLRALELSDSLPEAVRERQGPLTEMVSRESSVALAYGAFQRLKTIDRNDKTFLRGISRFLENTGQRNNATEEIAAFLRSLGFRVSYSVGAWQVAGKP